MSINYATLELGTKDGKIWFEVAAHSPGGENTPTGKLQQTDPARWGKGYSGWRTWFSLQEAVFEMGLERRVEKCCVQGEGDGDKTEWTLHGKAEAGRTPSVWQWPAGRVRRAKTRKTVWELPVEVLVCQVEEFGFLPADNRGPWDVFQQQANPMCSYSVQAEWRADWRRETKGAGNWLGRRLWHDEGLGQDSGAGNTRVRLDQGFEEGLVTAGSWERDQSQGLAWEAGWTVSFSSPSRSGGETFLPATSLQRTCRGSPAGQKL